MEEKKQAQVIRISRLHRRLVCAAAAVMLWILLVAIVLAAEPATRGDSAARATGATPITPTSRRERVTLHMRSYSLRAVC